MQQSTKPTSILSRFLRFGAMQALAPQGQACVLLLLHPCPVVTLRTPQGPFWEVKSGPPLLHPTGQQPTVTVEDKEPSKKNTGMGVQEPKVFR